MKKEKILIIEPDKKFAEKLFSQLKMLDCEIKIEDNFYKAIREIQDGNVQIVIMEVDLKEMKGYEAIPIIKNIDANIPIIMMTSNNSRELEKKVREEGVFYYHLKSFGIEDLFLAVKNAQKIIKK